MTREKEFDTRLTMCPIIYGLIALAKYAKYAKYAKSTKEIRGLP